MIHDAREDLRRRHSEHKSSQGTQQEQKHSSCERGTKHLRLLVDGVPCAATADPQRVHQALVNFIENAIKYSQPGGEVRISAAANNGAAVVEVSDQGVGIPPEELERIGERFFRASTTTNMPGTGLGLAITREIVERHGGRLDVDSEVGKGTNFRITLPRDGLTPR